MLVLLVFAALGSLGTAALAQETERIGGRLVAEGEGVPGVDIAVATADGELVGVGTSDDNGEWSVELPEAGTYLVTIDVATLPAGVDLRDPERQELELRVSEGSSATALFALGEREEVGSILLQRLAQSTFNGLKFGLIIAMTAIGLSLIFGTTGLINFAHGDLVTLGAFLAYTFNVIVGLHLIPSALIAIVLTAAFSGGIDAGLWRPLRRRGTGLIAMLVISIGLAFVIRHVVLFFFGGSRRPYSDYTLQLATQVGPVRVQPVELWVMGLSVLILVGVALMLTRTRLGKGMRAVADNRDLAESSGIDVQRVILSVWIMGGGLTAVGGIFLGMIESVDYLMGFRLLLLMFAGVILGGLGTAYGAMLGSLIVGLVSEVSTVFFSSQLKYVWALGVLIIILLVRPQGLLGQKERIG
ncbi:MAG: branched-chain amino acid ABC transporter permease [Nitriliruptor sp.]|nr:MAG: branched-chain amino acid ABC transporter permease [Nitriliruptor sp.]